jgi:ATP-dependent exoDNAse (exonuclease V) beta subunit
MHQKKICFVQASAGAGKTYTLAKRYIELLFKHNNTDIKNIVALTFTNKAAKEMKHRVISYLKQSVLHINTNTNTFFKEFKLTNKEIIIRSSNLLRHIFEYYENFNISTIDSFKNHILKACAINIGLSPDFSIEKDYSKNLFFALDKFLQQAILSKNLQHTILKQYLSQYLIKSHSWFPKYKIYNEIEKVFNKSSSIGVNFTFSQKPYFTRKLNLKATKIIVKLSDFSKLLMKANIHNTYRKNINKVLQYGPDTLSKMNIPQIFACKDILLKQQSKFGCEITEFWKVICKDIENFCNFYMKHYYDIYANIYSNIIKEFNKQAKQNNIVFLSELNKKIVGFLNKQNIPFSEMYYRLSATYKHFLIDEFQDTSLIQWLGIKKFVEEGLAIDGTLLYVGDQKQSIYTFRGVNTNIFNVIQNDFANLPITKQHLAINFRSGKAIVNFNNSIFSKKNIQRFLNTNFNQDQQHSVEYIKFLDNYNISEQLTIKNQHLGYINIKIVNTNKKNILSQIKKILITYITQLTKRFESKDITILCRKNKEVEIISSWLIESNFEIESNQSLNIKHNNIIKQIISLLTFINCPLDNLSFASFIIGNIFSKITQITSSKFEQFIFQANSVQNNKFTYQLFKDKYNSLWNTYFHNFFIYSTEFSIYDLNISIIEKFKIIENFPNSKAFIMCFLELINSFEQTQYGLRKFLEYFNSLQDTDSLLFVKGLFSNGIKIMTIHKAKGLQFPVVIIPFLKLFIQRGIQNPYLYYYKNKIRLFNVNKNIAKFSQKANKLYTQERFNLLQTELNILYVSMTRAIYELYGIVPNQKSKPYNNLIPKLFDCYNFINGYQDIYNSQTIDTNIILDNCQDGYKTVKWNFKLKDADYSI